MSSRGQQEGKRRRDQATGKVAAHHADDIRRIQHAILELLSRSREPQTIDAVSDQVPEAIRKHCVGAAVRGLSKDGVIEQEGSVVSSRPSRKSNLVRAWCIGTPAKVCAWRRENPAPDPPERRVVQPSLFGDDFASDQGDAVAA